MSSQDEILGRLRPLIREVEHPQPWQSRRDFGDLAARFTESLTAVLGEVIRAENLEDAWQKLGNLLREIEAERIVVNNEAPFTNSHLPERWPEAEWFIVGESEGDMKAFCETAEVGLTSTDAAFAETGSIVVSSGPGKSRLASLLPPIHIAMVPESKLETDIFTWTATRIGARSWKCSPAISRPPAADHGGSIEQGSARHPRST